VLFESAEFRTKDLIDLPLSQLNQASISLAFEEVIQFPILSIKRAGGNTANINITGYSI